MNESREFQKNIYVHEVRTREAAGGAESEWWRDCDAGFSMSAWRGTGFNPPPHRSPPQILEKKNQSYN
jgi:hypothetical protein